MPVPPPPPACPPKPGSTSPTFSPPRGGLSARPWRWRPSRGCLPLGGVGLGDGVLGVELLALQLRHQRINVTVAALPVDVSPDTVSFPWFEGRNLDADEAKTYTHLIAALCDMARNQKRITLCGNRMVSHLLPAAGLERTVAGEVAEQDFPLVLELGPDEAPQPLAPGERCGVWMTAAASWWPGTAAVPSMCCSVWTSAASFRVGIVYFIAAESGGSQLGAEAVAVLEPFTHGTSAA